MKQILLDGQSLTVSALNEISTGKVRVGIAPAAKKRIRTARQMIEKWVKSGETIYGVTTGFGEFANVRIADDKLEAGQTVRVWVNDA